MGNCWKEPTPLPFEVQLPLAPASAANSSYQDFPLSKRVSLASVTAQKTAVEGNRLAESPANPFAVQGNGELGKSLENLAKQIDESRNWHEGISQVGKFSRVLAETRRLEAKIQKIQRHSLNPADLPSHKAGKEDYLALEQELQQHMDVIMEDMGELKEDVADLELHVQGMKAKSLVRTQTSSVV
jgi:hypothetical protein